MGKFQAAKALETETLNWLAIAAAFSPTAQDISVVNTLIRGSKLDGAWRFLDVLRFTALSNASLAAIDLMSPSRTLTHVGSPAPSFTANRGFTYDGSQNYSRTGFTPSTGAVAMRSGSPITAMIGVWELNNVSSIGRYGAVFNSPASVYIAPRNGTGIQTGLNCAAATITSDSSSIGYTASQREADDSITLFRNEKVQNTSATVQAGTGLMSLEMYMGCYNNAGTPANFRANQLAVFFAGGRMGHHRHNAFYKRLLTALQTVGAA